MSDYKKYDLKGDANAFFANLAIDLPHGYHFQILFNPKAGEGGQYECRIRPMNAEGSWDLANEQAGAGSNFNESLEMN